MCEWGQQLCWLQLHQMWLVPVPALYTLNNMSADCGVLQNHRYVHDASNLSKLYIQVGPHKFYTCTDIQNWSTKIDVQWLICTGRALTLSLWAHTMQLHNLREPYPGDTVTVKFGSTYVSCYVTQEGSRGQLLWYSPNWESNLSINNIMKTVNTLSRS